MNDRTTDGKQPAHGTPDTRPRRCPGCDEEVVLIEIDPGTDLRKRPVMACLTGLFKPPGVKPGARYRCPLCSHEFTEARPADIVSVPIVLITLMVVTLITFLVLVSILVWR